jgi:hypothetical protein
MQLVGRRNCTTLGFPLIPNVFPNVRLMDKIRLGGMNYHPDAFV